MSDLEPVVRPRSDHCISRRDIDPDALKVLYRLLRRGFTAYLVGGGVRDLLLGRHPKDFDVSTAATPPQIKKLFNNCFLIGRRFRLAHIKYGDNIIETATFRRQPEQAADSDTEEENQLLQVEDNTFGTPEEDARRRDFTINGLFYDVDTFSVIDYVGGLKDLDAKLVRSIGDPEIRFREDPVRMIRAIRFAARLGFEIEEQTYQAILHHKDEIEKASKPRLQEEIYRLFAFGAGERAMRLLFQTGLMKLLMPFLAEHFEQEGDASPVWASLAAFDENTVQTNGVTPALILATLFYPLVMRHCDQTNEPVMPLAEKMLDSFSSLYCVARRIRDRYLRIVSVQKRFYPQTRRKFNRDRFVGQDYFREALILFLVHCHSSGEPESISRPWIKFTHSSFDVGNNSGSTEVAEQDVDENPRQSRRKRSKKRRRHKIDVSESARFMANGDSSRDSSSRVGDSGGKKHPSVGRHQMPEQGPPPRTYEDPDDSLTIILPGESEAESLEKSAALAGEADGNNQTEKKSRRRGRRRRKNKKAQENMPVSDGSEQGVSRSGESEEKVNPAAGKQPARNSSEELKKSDQTQDASQSHRNRNDNALSKAVQQDNGGSSENSAPSSGTENKEQKPHSKHPKPSESAKLQAPGYDPNSAEPHWLDEI